MTLDKFFEIREPKKYPNPKYNSIENIGWKCKICGYIIYIDRNLYMQDENRKREHLQDHIIEQQLDEMIEKQKVKRRES